MRMGEKMAKQNLIQIINVFALLLVGFVFLTNTNAEIENSGAEIANGNAGIIAMVDPAIYKPGDTNLTIYGSCLDSSSHPVSSNATITVYNRSQNKYVNNLNMSEMQPGRFNYSMTAPTAPGNYFVEINCTVGASWAVAYSNFQVSDWAGEISTINGNTDNAYSAGITLMGIGSAPSCPAGWTEVVGQTSAGTFAPVTSVTTTSIAPVTAITTTAANHLTALSTQSIAPVTSISTSGSKILGYSSAGCAASSGTAQWGTSIADGCQTTVLATGGDTTSYTVPQSPTFTSETFATGGSATSYTVANGGSATTYTLYYRVCALPR